jgi:PBP1b-binding outer membrane lipoprotein LpoB
MKQLLAVACSIATLFIMGCAGPPQPQEPAAEEAAPATEEESITTMDFESGEAETPMETSGEAEADSDGAAE